MANKQVKFENLLESDLKKNENSNAKSSRKKNSENIKNGKDKVESTDLKKKTKSTNKKTTSTIKKVNSKNKDANSKSSTEKKASKKESVSSKKTTNKKNAATSKKTTASPAKKASSKRTVKGRNSKVSVSQEDMDKLCEVYDWYMQVKDLDIIKEKTKIKKTSIKIEDDIIKSKKRISAVVDNDVWAAFDRLCNNTEEKKGEMLTFAIKDFLLKHKDLI